MATESSETSRKSCSMTGPQFHDLPHEWPEGPRLVVEKYDSLHYRRLPKRKTPNVNFLGYDTRRYPQSDRFDYQLFYNEVQECLLGVVYFGSCLEGPRGNVHGGAISAILDAAMGTVAWCSGRDCVTLHLEVDFRNFVPLNSFVHIEARIARIEGKKVYVESKLGNLDEIRTKIEGEAALDASETLYAQGSTLYYVYSELKGSLDLDDYGFMFPQWKDDSPIETEDEG